GLEARCKGDFLFADRLGPGIEVDTSPADYAIEPLVGQYERSAVELALQALASSVALHAADFEAVGAIGVHLQRERAANAVLAVVRDPETFVEDALPEEVRAMNVESVAGKDDRPVGLDSRVGEIDDQKHVGRAVGGTEK